MSDINCSTKTRAYVIVRKGEDIDSALRRFKKKVDDYNVIGEAYSHTFFLKPSLAKREKRVSKKEYE